MKYDLTYFRNLYDRNYRRVTWNPGDELRRFRMMQIAKKVKPGDKVLDYGAGDGMLKKYLVGAAYTAVDLSGEHRADDTRVRLIEGLYLDSKDQSFDVVVMSEVLEHIPNCFETLMEVNRVLKPGGRLIITVPNPFSPLFFLRSFVGQHQDPSLEHLYWFDWSYLSNLLLSCGFKLKEKITFMYLPCRFASYLIGVESVLSGLFPHNGAQLLCTFIKNLSGNDSKH